MGRYADNLKQSATDAGQDAKIEALEGLLTQGTSAPSTKPAAKNLLYYATTSQKMYVSTGTSSSSDWKEVKAVAIT